MIRLMILMIGLVLQLMTGPSSCPVGELEFCGGSRQAA